MTIDQPQMFELGGLFATVDTIETTPIEQIALPREHDPAQVRAMFSGLGWGTTTPDTSSAAVILDRIEAKVTKTAPRADEKTVCPRCGDSYGPRAAWVRDGDSQCYQCQAGRPVDHDERTAQILAEHAPALVVDVPPGALF